MGQCETKGNNAVIGKFFFLISLILVLVIGKFYFELSLLNFALFIVYTFVYAYLPGRIMSDLLKIDSFDYMLGDIVAFFLGIFLLFIQYFLFSLLNCLFLIKFMTPVALLLGFIYLLFQKKKIRVFPQLRILDNAAYLLMGVNIAISAVFSLFAYPKPTVVSNVITNVDMAWHMGNVNILATGTSVDSRVYGVKFLYHYFSDLFYAIAKYIFGISSYELIIQFQFFLIGTLVTISLIGFFKTVFEGKSGLTFIAVVLFLYAPIVANGYYNTIFFHLFTNVNAMLFTLPVLLILFLIIKNNLALDSSVLNIFLIAIFMFLLAGFKGPVAFVVLVTLFLFTIPLLFQKKVTISWLCFLAAATLSYVIIHFTLLSQGSGLVEIGLDSAFDVITNTTLMPEDAKGNFFITFTYVIPHFLLVVYFFSIPFIWSVVHNIYRLVTKKKVSTFTQFSLIFSIMSLGAYYLIRHSGYSQMYFLFGALPIIYFLGGQELKRVSQTSEKELKIVFLITLSLFSLRPIFGTADMIQKQIAQSQSNFNSKQIDFSTSSLTSLEYEGMMWLKKNTTTDDLLATNRHNVGNRFFLYSAYSERNFYIEGSEYAKNSGLTATTAQEMLNRNDVLFSPDYKNKHNLAMELNLAYIVQFKKLQPLEIYKQESGFKRVFDNEDISIYKVIR